MMNSDAWLASERSLERYHDALRRVEHEQVVSEAQAMQCSYKTGTTRSAIARRAAALLVLC